jgi:ElaB/YqjD/DUF883 family membrane-anchored ribosome-binding protein
MHLPVVMETDTKTTSQAAPTTEGGTRTSQELTPHRPDGAIRFAREHPAASVLGAAAVGLFGGIELAAGLVLGAGLFSLLRPKKGESPIESQAVRDRARRVLERTPRELLKRARAVVQAARGKVAPVEESPEATQQRPSSPPATPTTAQTTVEQPRMPT